MITRFDHAVIAVRELDAAMQRYRALGFDVRAGGQHVGLGTYNALIRFGLDYIELLSVYDEPVAASSGPRGEVLVDFLRKQEGGPIGYALATTNIEQEAECLQANSVAAVPFAMQRIRPDGNLLSWHLLLPGKVAWRRSWPFLIQWDTPDEQRLLWEGTGRHANEAVGWTGIAVAVRDLERISDLYQHQLGLQPGSRDEVPQLRARRATFQVGSSSIELLMPIDDGPVQQMLEEIGEGPFEIILAVRNLDRARTYLTQQGVDLEPDSVDPSRVRLPPSQTLGVRLVLQEQEG